jgi:hypothetical protein
VNRPRLLQALGLAACVLFVAAVVRALRHAAKRSGRHKSKQHHLARHSGETSHRLEIVTTTEGDPRREASTCLHRDDADRNRRARPRRDHPPLRGRLCAENAEGGIDVKGETDGCGAAREMKEPDRVVGWPFAVALQGEAANVCHERWEVVCRRPLKAMLCERWRIVGPPASAYGGGR